MVPFSAAGTPPGIPCIRKEARSRSIAITKLETAKAKKFFWLLKAQPGENDSLHARALPGDAGPAPEFAPRTATIPASMAWSEGGGADEQVLRELTERARAGGLRLTGEGGLLEKLTKMVVEGALEGELDDHLGYCRHDPVRPTPRAPSPPCPGCRTRPWRRSQPAARLPAPAGTGAWPRPRSRPTAGPVRLSSRPRSCPPPACATVGRHNRAPGRDDHHRRDVSGPQGAPGIQPPWLPPCARGSRWPSTCPAMAAILLRVRAKRPGLQERSGGEAGY